MIAVSTLELTALGYLVTFSCVHFSEGSADPPNEMKYTGTFNQCQFPEESPGKQHLETRAEHAAFANHMLGYFLSYWAPPVACIYRHRIGNNTDWE